MNVPNLNVCVASASASELRGHVMADDALNGWIRAGTEIAIALNPEGSAYNDSNIIGGGRIYDDRIEVDLMLPAEAAAALVDAVGSQPSALRLSTRAITETIFRIEAITPG